MRATGGRSARRRTRLRRLRRRRRRSASATRAASNCSVSASRSTVVAGRVGDRRRARGRSASALPRSTSPISAPSWPELTTSWANSSGRMPACWARRTIVSVSSASLTVSSSLRGDRVEDELRLDRLLRAFFDLAVDLLDRLVLDLGVLLLGHARRLQLLLHRLLAVVDLVAEHVLRQRDVDLLEQRLEHACRGPARPAAARRRARAACACRRAARRACRTRSRSARSRRRARAAPSP